MNNVNGDLDSAGTYGVEDEQFIGICPGCEGSGEGYAGRLASQPGVCRECDGNTWVVIDRW